jgi:LysM repeat protein
MTHLGAATGHRLTDTRGAPGSGALRPTCLLRRHLLLRVLVAGGAVVLAACNGDSRNVEESSTAPSRTSVAPTTTTTPPPLTYEVKSGDTLTSIARFFRLSPAVIAMANQLANPDQLTAGQVLTIPPTPPAQLTVMPNFAQSGQAFMFILTGAIAGETVTFEISAPDGGKFTGPPHAASQDGAVTASYNSAGEGPGTYTVVATGDGGTSVQASYLVLG